MKIMVSACLVSENCKYNGGSNRNEKVLEFIQDQEVILICPEVMGGLPTPRIPAEITGEQVMTRDGRDVTEEYFRGAQLTLELAQKVQPDLIILQSRSPSCGVKQRYDGTFTGTLIEGSGVTARLLTRHGFSVIDVEDL